LFDPNHAVDNQRIFFVLWREILIGVDFNKINRRENFFQIVFEQKRRFIFLNQRTAENKFFYLSSADATLIHRLYCVERGIMAGSFKDIKNIKSMMGKKRKAVDFGKNFSKAFFINFFIKKKFFLGKCPILKSGQRFQQSVAQSICLNYLLIENILDFVFSSNQLQIRIKGFKTGKKMGDFPVSDIFFKMMAKTGRLSRAAETQKIG
jgi:hypothetical protein